MKTAELPLESAVPTKPRPLARLGARYKEVALMSPRLKHPKAYVNWMRANWELLRGASDIKAKPLKITFDPTNVCQLRCPLCPTGLQAQDREQGHAGLHMFEKLLGELGDHLFFIDFFNWGEPLLNTHIEDFVRLAAARKITSRISTNLSLPLTDERIERIIKSGLNEILVSLDGASVATYGLYRRRGNFDLVVNNMRRLIEAKRRLGLKSPLVTWQFLVFGFNEHEIPRAQAMALDIGVEKLIFVPAFLDEGRYPMAESDKSLVATWKPKDPLYQIENASGNDARPRSRCGWHYMSAAVNWDGTVASCCTTFSKQDDFGTIGPRGETSFMEVFNNAAFRSVRERFAGRRKERVNLVCETCPTPAIMDYHKFLNRQVILYTAVSVLEWIRQPFSGPPHRQSNNH
jgi:MoaA/NifB/PqqE/SkfB family radical SAM enzyme